MSSTEVIKPPEVPAESPAPPAPKASPGEWTMSFQSLLGTVVIAVFVITFIVQAFQIPSESMERTLLVGDFLLVDKFCYGGDALTGPLLPYRAVRRGDIVVFHYPVNPAQHFVKRVIGVPGDRVRLVERKVLINGVPLAESYTQFSSPVHDIYRDDFPRTDIAAAGMEASWWLQMRKLVEDNELIVPEGNYFVLGDNRDRSQDSRYWGFVPRENIVGRPLLIYWSMRSLDEEALAVPPSDKLYRFYYAVSHLFQMTRWDRTFRFVK